MDKFVSEKSEKKKKFKEHKTPRYLPGSVDNGTIRRDLIEYNKHLYKIFNPQSKVDSTAPTFYPRKYFKIIKIQDDLFNLKRIERDNKDLVKKINKINRSKGQVDTFNFFAYKNLSKWHKKEEQLNDIAKENKRLYNKLLKTKPSYPTAELEEEWKITLSKLHHFSKYPILIFQKKTLDEELLEDPSISSYLKPLYEVQRLQFYIEFQIENGLTLGKVIAELYLDYVPNVVQTFLQLCQSESIKGNRIKKIYKNRYCIVGNLTKTNKKHEEQKYYPDDEQFMLKHSKAGVLSMAPSNPDRKTTHFYITFDKIPEFDGKQMVFGKIIFGAKNLFKINDLGSRFGRPIGNIFISSCGILQNN